MLQCDMDCQAQPNHQVSFLPSSAQAKLIQAGLRLALFSVLAGQEKFLMSKPKVLVVSNFGKWVYSIITIKLAL